ncbi:LuxR C-terminal-related transcriptional regulator [Lacisediminihabitans sp.]|uniref:helix-turn-helix transcriptional regulator n=1 Tax=Lacisediminihabitans sp. TaxID=2787631 RepID=UPI00374D1990
MAEAGAARAGLSAAGPAAEETFFRSRFGRRPEDPAEPGVSAPLPKRVLALGLSERSDELSAAMLAGNHFGSAGAHGDWLKERYREILPPVLPDALRCMETGSRLEPASLAVIRSSALAMRDANVPLSVVLRGSIPALRVFSAFIHASETGLNARDLTVLMGRAALIAGELGACWAESWADSRGIADARAAVTDGDSLDLVPVAGTVESPALEMLALVAAGQSNEQIAEATDYSQQAVKWHLARVMRSWKVDNRAALVSVALVRGVLIPRRTRPGAQEPLETDGL